MYVACTYNSKNDHKQSFLKLKYARCVLCNVRVCLITVQVYHAPHIAEVFIQTQAIYEAIKLTFRNEIGIIVNLKAEH